MRWNKHLERGRTTVRPLREDALHDHRCPTPRRARSCRDRSTPAGKTIWIVPADHPADGSERWRGPLQCGFAHETHWCAGICWNCLDRECGQQQSRRSGRAAEKLTSPFALRTCLQGPALPSGSVANIGLDRRPVTICEPTWVWHPISFLTTRKCKAGFRTSLWRTKVVSMMFEIHRLMAET